MDNLKGLELLFLLTRDQFTCKEDCLVAVFHCLMINDGKRCVGSGDEWPEASVGGGSETLPPEWNSSHDVYSLRYVSVSSSCRYLLKIVKAGQSLLVNVLDVSAEKAAGMSVNAANHVSDNYKDFSNAFVNLTEVSRNFHNEVLNQFTKQPSGTCTDRHQESADKTDNPKLRKKEKEQDSRPNPRISERVRLEEERSFPFVGEGDLNPFSGGMGGGMLADPRNLPFQPRPGVSGGFDPRGLPRGAVPPGARFDPFGPPGTGRGFPGPDPDHLPPPGYDDIFM